MDASRGAQSKCNLCRRCIEACVMRLSSLEPKNKNELGKKSCFGENHAKIFSQTKCEICFCFVRNEIYHLEGGRKSLGYSGGS